jgi:hypothetical protein
MGGMGAEFSVMATGKGRKRKMTKNRKNEGDKSGNRHF